MTYAFLHNKQRILSIIVYIFPFFLCVQACLKLFYMFSSLFEYVCYIIFWIFWDPLQLVFHILPMTNIVPWPPSHILDLFWRLVSASGRRYHNISVGICFWKLKRILENKILCPTCHVFLLSPICHFWMIDPCSNKIQNLLGPLPSAIVLQCFVLQCSCAAGLVCCSANVMQC